MRVLFLSDTHLGFDLPTRPRVVRRRRGDEFFQNFERALEPARTGEVDVVVHGGDLLYRSRVPAWLAEAALAPLKDLAESGVPVLLVPGNHERSRMPFPLLALHEQLHIFHRPRTLVLEARGVRVAFMGLPYTHDIRRRFPEILTALNTDAWRQMFACCAFINASKERPAGQATSRSVSGPTSSALPTCPRTSRLR